MTPAIVPDIACPLDDPAARAAWDRYAAKLPQALVPLPAGDAAELRTELLGHLADSVAAGNGGEAARMTAAIARLGEPAEYLQPLLAERLIAAGSRRFDPVLLVAGMRIDLRRGVRAAALAVLAAIVLVVTLALAAMAVLSPLLPLNVGLLDYADGTRMFGISSVAGVRELLGWRRVPIGVAGALIGWRAITRLFIILRR